MGAFDWDSLRSRAIEVSRRAYAPYSRFPVGAAAAVAGDGRTVVGCNVENASFGITLCAECGLISNLYATGGGTLTHFVCVNKLGNVIMPCGRCRQLLYEHGGRDLLVLTPAGVRGMGELLPMPFEADDAVAVANQDA